MLSLLVFLTPTKLFKNIRVDGRSLERLQHLIAFYDYGVVEYPQELAGVGFGDDGWSGSGTVIFIQKGADARQSFRQRELAALFDIYISVVAGKIFQSLPTLDDFQIS